MEIIDITDNEQIPGVVIGVDYEKAFDSLDWGFIDQAMRFFNFGDDLCKWVKMFYSNISSCVINNGWASQFFSIERGVRQGCPLSPYLFIICAELFSCNVRNNSSIKGIQIGDTEYKLSLYADDTTIFVDGKETTINNALTSLHRFGRCSGLKVNFSKSKAYKIGSLRDKNITYTLVNQISWCRGPIEMLGVRIPLDDKHDISELNYIPKIDLMRGVFNTWQQRNLSLAGRITIAQCLGLSMVTYLASVLPDPPETIFKEIDSLFFGFIWGGKNDKIKRTTMMNRKECGGLQAPSFRAHCAAMKVAWVGRICKSPNNSILSNLYNYLMLRVGGKFLFQCNLHYTDIPQFFKQSLFLYNVLHAWCNVNYQHCPSNQSNCIIWFNSKIKMNGKVIFIRKLFEHGVKLCTDFFSGGNVISHANFCSMYNTCINFVTYYGLITSLLIFRKNIGIETHGPLNTWLSPIFRQIKNPNFTKTAYWQYLTLTLTTPEKAKHRWAMRFGTFTEDVWKSIFTLPYKCTVEVRCRIFQFKLLHRQVFTNNILFKIGKVQSQLCNLCNIQVDDLFHRFWDCITVKAFWRNFCLWVHHEYDINVTLDPFSVIFGHNYKCPNLLLEHLIIIAKKYIDVCAMEKHFYQ